jgi:hypothetical protein
VSPFRGRKALNLGPWIRVNFTLRSVADWLRDWFPDGHVDPGRRPWSSLSIGPRGASYNTRRRTARIDLPGPFSYETPPLDRDDGDPDDGCRLCGGLPGDRSSHWPGCSRAPSPPPVRWTDEGGRAWEQTERPDGGTTTRYLPDPVTDDEAEAQPCPRCRAEPDHPCRTRGTGRPTEPHMPRIELARLARTTPPPATPDGEVPPWGTPPPDPTGDDRP